MDDLEEYRRVRGKEDSFWKKNHSVSQATVNKEISAFKSLLNKAVKHGKIEKDDHQSGHAKGQ